MSLYTATANTHHDAEQHPFGERLATGTLTREEYAAWIYAMCEIHFELDAYLPPCLQRLGALTLDLLALGGDPSREFMPSIDHIFEHKEEGGIGYVGGLAYIVCGANLRGGQVIKKTLEPLGFPCNHATFYDFKEPNAWLEKFREMDHLADAANQAFRDIIAIMDQIYEHVTPAEAKAA